MPRSNPRPSDEAASEVVAPYAALHLDRATGRREDSAWVAAALGDPRRRVWPLWRDQCLVAGAPPAPVELAPGAAGTAPEGLVLLGLDGDRPEFAVDLSELPLDEALAIAGADAAADVRSLFAGLPASRSGVLGYARGLLYWHRHHRYCGRCGSATASRSAGHLRACTSGRCGRLLFPRIEPAVITLVETAGLPRRCLLARHRASKVGGYSLLAGFVEVGESLEDAVRREILEEAGVRLAEITYYGSQPWPFPAGLMLGFRATAASEAISVDGDELLEARWFTRDDLRCHGDAGGRLGRPDSIDRMMLTAWLADADDVTSLAH